MTGIVYFFSFADTTVSFRPRHATEFRANLRKTKSQCDSAKNWTFRSGGTPRPLLCQEAHLGVFARFLPANYSGQTPRIASLILRRRPKILRRSGKFFARCLPRSPAGIRARSAVKSPFAPAARCSIPERVVKNPERRKGRRAHAPPRFRWT